MLANSSGLFDNYIGKVNVFFSFFLSSIDYNRMNIVCGKGYTVIEFDYSHGTMRIDNNNDCCWCFFCFCFEISGSNAWV